MRTLVAVSLLAVLVSGCGAAAQDSSKSFKGPQAAVATVVENIEKAARADDPGKVCSQLLDSALLAAIKAQGTICKTGTKEAFKDADSFDLTVKKVTITGATAKANVTAGTGSKKRSYVLALRRIGTAWKIDSLE